MSPKAMAENTLFYGDNLPILREHIASASIDLVYLDPPFNSNRSYNVLFADESGKESEAQITAFEDTWHWDQSAARTYHEMIQNGPLDVVKVIGALHDLLGENQMTAYLVMMAVRLVELHRVLKPTGSLYLHCDPTASHYLKIVLDTVFGPQNFRNEVIWQRTLAKALMSRQLPNNHDVIFCYQKSSDAKWNADAMFQEYDESELDEKTASKYRHFDPDGRIYRLDNLINPNPDRPNLTYEFLGVTRVWRWTKDRMQAAYEEGLVVQTSPGRVPQLKRYLDEQRGRPLGDVWIDIPPINSQAAERLGYPTQKPLVLLERIIQASSNPGDWVLDPFCGCGTAIAAAQKLDRHWIGIDITHLAISLQKYRLQDTFGITAGKDYQVIGEPCDEAAAAQLAKDNRYQFQWWALSLVGAKPLGGEQDSKTGKKGKDRGIDGVINFVEAKGKPKRVLVQVKSGHVNSGLIRDLRGTVEREDAAIGFFITLEPATSEMEKEALAAGYYTSELWQKDYQRIQILTIPQLLAGAEVDMPAAHGTFKQARRVKTQEGTQHGLGM
jgi:site-specific DNA-methyltransferase (adenine-specific)